MGSSRAISPLICTSPTNNTTITFYNRVADRNEKLLKDPTRLRQISERIPAGRWGDPKDFAGPVVFLASGASQYVCGELLVVDGVSTLISHISRSRFTPRTR